MLVFGNQGRSETNILQNERNLELTDGLVEVSILVVGWTCAAIVVVPLELVRQKQVATCMREHRVPAVGHRDTSMTKKCWGGRGQRKVVGKDGIECDRRKWPRMSKKRPTDSTSSGKLSTNKLRKYFINDETAKPSKDTKKHRMLENGRSLRSGRHRSYPPDISRRKRSNTTQRNC